MTLETINLTGHFLMAMPNMQDPFFAKSVTYICTHNQDGAMGIIINRPTDMTIDDLFEKINLNVPRSTVTHQSVLFGGPVQTERGFVLHPANHEDEWDSSIMVNAHTALTTSKDILAAVSNGNGPQNMLLALGYAGWTPGQLEKEMMQNAWLSTHTQNIETLHHILYHSEHSKKLSAAMQLLGFDPTMLSDIAGHA